MNTSTRLIFSAPHQKTIIGVFYSVEADDRSKGFDIYVGDELWARVFNPIDVTRWFLRCSRANLEKWRTTYHSSGLTGADFQRPQPNDIVLEVPYFSQRDNERSPGGTCNVTSYSMVLDYYHAPRKAVKDKQWEQREDELEAFIQANGKVRHSHEALAWAGRQYGLDCRFGMNRTWDEIRAEIRAGRPVIVSGQFTKSGHIIVIIGLRGNDFIVNDPWGNALTGYKNRNGAGLVYDFDYMERTVKDGKNSKWAHFIRPKAA